MLLSLIFIVFYGSLYLWHIKKTYKSWRKFINIYSRLECYFLNLLKSELYIFRLILKSWQKENLLPVAQASPKGRRLLYMNTPTTSGSNENPDRQSLISGQC